MTVRKTMVAGLLALGAVGLVNAAENGAHEDAGHMHRMHHAMMQASVEVAAMHNILAEEISAKTGKPAAEIKALFEKSNPHEALQQLGLSHDDMRTLHQQAHATLVDRAAAAGLITAEQARRLREAPLPEPADHRGPPSDDDGH